MARIKNPNPTRFISDDTPPTNIKPVASSTSSTSSMDQSLCPQQIHDVAKPDCPRTDSEDVCSEGSTTEDHDNGYRRKAVQETGDETGEKVRNVPWFRPFRLGVPRIAKSMKAIRVSMSQIVMINPRKGKDPESPPNRPSRAKKPRIDN